MRILRLGIDPIEEILRELGWDRHDIPRCFCALPLPEVGSFCGTEQCRDRLRALPLQATEIDLDSDSEPSQ